MKFPHLVRVDQGPEPFAPLLAAVGELGLRAGWLCWEEAALEPPPELAAAALAGAPKVVAVGPRGSVAVKGRKGSAVLGDVLREHFLGFHLVLVAGAAPESLPRLAAVDGRYRVVMGERAAGPFTAAQVAVLLRRPRPWDAALAAPAEPS